MKAFITYDGVDYEDYDVLFCNYCFINDNNAKFIIDNEHYNRAIRGELFDKTINPLKGSSLHIVQPFPIAVDDIRKNYKIKRDPALADFVAISDVSRDKRGRIWTLVIVPAYKYIFADINYSDSLDLVIDIAKGVVFDQYLDWDKDVIAVDLHGATTATEIFTIEGNQDALYDYFAGKLKSKAVPPAALDLGSGIELTTDTLRLIYFADNHELKKHITGEEIEKMKLQLEALNQTDWRKYPGTMSLLFNILIYNNGVYHYMRARPSGYNKTIKQFFKVPASEPKSKEDFIYCIGYFKRKGSQGMIARNLSERILPSKGKNIK